MMVVEVRGLEYPRHVTEEIDLLSSRAWRRRTSLSVPGLRRHARVRSSRRGAPSAARAAATAHPAERGRRLLRFHHERAARRRAPATDRHPLTWVHRPARLRDQSARPPRPAPGRGRDGRRCTPPRESSRRTARSNRSRGSRSRTGVTVSFCTLRSRSGRPPATPSSGSPRPSAGWIRHRRLRSSTATASSRREWQVGGRGDALIHILKDADAGSALAIYVGDDVTDEGRFRGGQSVGGRQRAGYPMVRRGRSRRGRYPGRGSASSWQASRDRHVPSFSVRDSQEVYEFLSSLSAIASTLF